MLICPHAYILKIKFIQTEMLSKLHLFHNGLMGECASAAKQERAWWDAVANRHLISICGGEQFQPVQPPAGRLYEEYTLPHSHTHTHSCRVLKLIADRSNKVSGKIIIMRFNTEYHKDNLGWWAWEENMHEEGLELGWQICSFNLSYRFTHCTLVPLQHKFYRLQWQSKCDFFKSASLNF